MAEESAKETAPLPAAKRISRRAQSACLRFFLNAAPKRIFVGYPNQFTIESFALLTRFRRIPDRPAAESLPALKTIGEYAWATIVSFTKLLVPTRLSVLIAFGTAKKFIGENESPFTDHVSRPRGGCADIYSKA